MTQHYLYGGKSVGIQSTAGVKGILIRTADRSINFRGHIDKNCFTDYKTKHDDLSVTIDKQELAAFYRIVGALPSGS